MQNVAAVAGLLGTVLIIVVPLLMLVCLLFLFGSRSRVVLTGEARKLSVEMVLSHFGGFAVFVAANAIPVQQMALRVIVAYLGILLLGVLPSAACVTLIRRGLIPRAMYRFGWFVAGATGLLALLLLFVVRAATLAVQAASG